MSQAGIANLALAIPTIATSYNGDAGTAAPAANILNVLGGQANYVTGSGSTLTVGWFKWNPIAGTSQQMAIKNAYVCQNAGLTTLTLPATAAIGDCVLVANTPTNGNGGGFKVAQNAGQQIVFDNQATTVGATGFIDNSAGPNLTTSIILQCIETNTTWAVFGSINSLSAN